MPTQKQILASIDARLALVPQIAADLKTLLGPPPVVEQPPAVEPPDEPPVVVDPPAPIPAGGMSAAQMIAAKLVMPFSRANVVNGGSLPSYWIGDSWSSVGLASDMGATGERQEIGVETDAIADFLMGGSSNNMIAQATAHKDVPVHFLADDGYLPNAIRDPQATCDYRAVDGGWTPFYPIMESPITPEWAHYPSVSYVPFLHTGDRKYLPELQHAANFMIINAPPDFRAPARINDIQHRGLAWGLREVAKAYIATKIAEAGGTLPKPFHPSSYWRTVLTNIRTRMEGQWLNSTSTLVKNTHMWPSGEPFAGCIAPWQHDYISMVLGWMIYTGQFEDFRPLYNFQVQQAIIRASGPLRSRAIGYELESNGASDWPGVLNLNGMGTPTSDGNFPDTVKNQHPHYAGLLRASLKLAVLNNVTGSQPAYDYADAQAKRVGLISLRHAV